MSKQPMKHVAMVDESDQILYHEELPKHRASFRLKMFSLQAELNALKKRIACKTEKEKRQVRVTDKALISDIWPPVGHIEKQRKVKGKTVKFLEPAPVEEFAPEKPQEVELEKTAPAEAQE
jgi:hypothetical protein